jgi:hypothetical protein
MSENKTYQGKCFCGAVEITVSGEPAEMGYCHCTSCRTWSASPVNAFVLWKRDAVKVTKGSDEVGTFSKSPNSFRSWCKVCGGHLMTEHPLWGLMDVYAATTPGFPFRARLHVNCGETVLPLSDGLPKQNDLPKEMGGSGRLIS